MPKTVKVELNESPSPSQQVVAKANAEIVITDDRGRAIKLKKPGVLSQYRLIEAAGPETAKNPVYMGMILPLIYVTEIDGDQVFLPTTKREIEALIQQLDEDGIDAVMKALEKHFNVKKADPEADKVALKN